MTRSSKPDSNRDALSESPVFGDLNEDAFDEAFDEDVPSATEEDWGDLIDQEDDESEEEPDEEPRLSRGSRSSRRTSSRPSRTTKSSGSPLLAFGLIGGGALWGAATLAAGAKLASINGKLGEIGLTPAAMIFVGLVLFAIQKLGRQNQAQSAQVTEEFESIAAQLEALGAPQEGGDLMAEQLDRVLLAADRQMEKILNLTKATKMYGKPLVDISKQVADLGVYLGEIQKLPEQFDTFRKEQQQSASESEVEEQLREVSRVARGVQSGVREIHEQLGEAIAKRVESLSAQIAAATVEFANREPENDSSEELGSIRRELQAVTTGLSQLSTKIAQMPTRVAAAPAATASGSTAAPDAPSPQSSATAPAADSALAQKIAGARPGGKGVMSAIEKLKSMRG
ncbi:MAG: hypothetical protein AAF196_08160 [Planctomycetota bacterium]